MNKKVFVSGCFDMLHSGHVAFFKEASSYGDLYVGIGSDKTIEELKSRKPINSEQERLYMVKSIKYVKGAYINNGNGIMDFVNTIEIIKPNIFIVNEDGDYEEKRKFCEKNNIEYIILKRIPDNNLEKHSTTEIITKTKCQLPYRLDIAGTWIDQPYVSCLHSGWAITISLEPTIEFMERAGMSTSTRNAAKKIWKYHLPNENSEILAKILFCLENEPNNNGYVSGAQDAIGICIPCLSRHYYNGNYWPEKIETCNDEKVLTWLEEHICMIPMFPREKNISVTDNKNITFDNVKKLSEASENCWESLLKCDLNSFATNFQKSFQAQISMFPSMMQPKVQEYIDKYRNIALAWKMSGAGGGGYLILVCENKNCMPLESLKIKIRRSIM